MLMPFRKKLLPNAPSAVNVLWRSLVAHQRMTHWRRHHLIT
jgi:NTE family protein